MDTRLAFHRFEQRGFTFIGFIGSEGPSIAVAKSVFRLGSVPFGVMVALKHDKHRGWHLHKLGADKGIHLEGLDDDTALTLSDEFGITMETSGVVRDKHYRDSKAWKALCDWCVLNRNTAKAHSSSQTYMPGWYDQALRDSRGMVGWN